LSVITFTLFLTIITPLGPDIHVVHNILLNHVENHVEKLMFSVIH